jgi:ADP-ribosyl-[dinitrogen reductase] hydrolase
MTNRINLDRAAGALVGMAAGDALGAGYEFGPPLADSTTVHMAGGGGFNWAPGEWTDDTSMAIPIARTLAARGRDILNPESGALDEIVAAWAEWASTAKDVGIQTRAVLGRMSAPTAANARAAARAVHNASGRSAGNGSLMRTGPVALGYLNDPDGLAIAARAVSDLTHFEADAGDACVLWSLAIRHAILTGEMNVRVGMPYLPKDRRGRWLDIIDDAEQKQPRDFEHNGWVVQALQGAWSAIHHSNAQCAAAATPTPSQRSPAPSSAPRQESPASPHAGAASFTAGPECKCEILSTSRYSPCAVPTRRDGR